MKELNKSLLRLTTTGSVDDGKSTLLGRLLYDTNSIFLDQYASISETSKRSGKEDVDLSLLLDGLASEREQGITIDVAYRYFSTAKRKFIVTDTPGHEQYTRNMVTGASNAELAIILIDARKGMQTQSKRHGYLLSLLQVPHMIVAINKMDLVDYSQEVYDEIVADYVEFSGKLDIHDISFIPISALKGDNVASRSEKMPWYQGETLLHVLENVHIVADKNMIDFRFPVQNVLRPDLNFRGFAGTVTSGTIRVGDEIAVLPSGKKTKVKEIVTYDGSLSEATNGRAIVLNLEDEIDISRGDMLVKPNNLPTITDHINAFIIWMDDEPLDQSTPYILKHTTSKVKAFVSKIHYTVNVNNGHRNKGVKSFSLNDTGRIELKTVKNIYCDSYRKNQGTGSFILIDPISMRTVASGMIQGPVTTLGEINDPVKTNKSSNIVWQKGGIEPKQYSMRNGHKPAVLWLTGFSGSGKSTIAETTAHRLFEKGHKVILLDGDNVRHGLCGDLNFSIESRTENIRRVSEVAKLFYNTGHIVICSFISPLKNDRLLGRELIEKGFFEVYVKCDIEECIKRDVKGLYAKAIAGEIPDFTGISSPYEAPENAEITIDTMSVSVEQSAEMLLEALEKDGIFTIDD
ncbi:MAG: sulfate adenylyltransferase subunit CysN [SAR324 cluster bacterium]|nr:sulfate adenylyltransferase subunit CysN [SAR324 cluster bacterium]